MDRDEFTKVVHMDQIRAISISRKSIARFWTLKTALQPVLRINLGSVTHNRAHDEAPMS